MIVLKVMIQLKRRSRHASIDYWRWYHSSNRNDDSLAALWAYSSIVNIATSYYTYMHSIYLIWMILITQYRRLTSFVDYSNHIIPTVHHHTTMRLRSERRLLSPMISSHVSCVMSILLLLAVACCSSCQHYTAACHLRWRKKNKQQEEQEDGHETWPMEYVTKHDW